MKLVITVLALLGLPTAFGAIDFWLPASFPRPDLDLVNLLLFFALAFVASLFIYCYAKLSEELRDLCRELLAVRRGYSAEDQNILNLHG